MTLWNSSSLRLLFSGALVFALLGGCGGGGDDAPRTAAPSNLSYPSPQTLVVGTAANLTPTVTGTPTSYSVTPALPPGMSLSSATGVVSGTPTASAAQATYTITASNSGGSTPFALVLTVNPETASGHFIDAVVSGLSYTSGSQSGVTDADGSFTYEVGQSVTFHVGDVTLGTVAGADVVTPLDFVPGSSSTTLAVQNIVRFLLLMDSDGNAANGITISEGLRARAEDWPSVDFSTSDLSAALATIVPDTQVDGALRQLPSAADAQTHFELSFRCLYAGYFRGTYSGEDNGNFALAIHPAGFLSGAAYSVPDQQLIGLMFPTQLPVRNGASFVAGLVATGSSFSGQFSSYEDVSGTWTDGVFSGTRYGGTTSAAYKFISVLVPSGGGAAVGSALMEIDTDDTITLTPHVNFATNEHAPISTGPLNAGTFAFTTAAGSISGTVDKQALTLTGTWTNVGAGTSGTLISTGCRLR